MALTMTPLNFPQRPWRNLGVFVLLTRRVQKNDGRKQFSQKWKIPSSYFYKNMLLLGNVFDVNQTLKSKKDIGFYWAKLRALWISK